MHLLYPYNVRTPLGNDIIIFRNQKDGYRYYKRSDNSIVRISNQVSGDVYILPEKISGQIFNTTGEEIETFLTDAGTGLSFYRNIPQPGIVSSGAFGLRGSRGPAGPQGPAGAGSSASGFQVLPDAPVVVWDVNLGGFGQVTLNGNRTLQILNAEPGVSYAIRTIQGTGGGFTLALTDSEVVNDGQGELLFSAQQGARDLHSVIYDGTIFSWTDGLFFSSAP